MLDFAIKEALIKSKLRQSTLPAIEGQNAQIWFLSVRHVYKNETPILIIFEPADVTYFIAGYSEKLGYPAISPVRV